MRQKTLTISMGKRQHFLYRLYSIVYAENPNDFADKLLDIIKEFSKFTMQKVNKNYLYCHISNKQIKKTKMPFKEQQEMNTYKLSMENIKIYY